MNIAAIDWLILGAGFCFFLAWAIYLNIKCRSVADYLVSGRKVRMWLGMGAGIGGEIGLVSIAAMCEQGFARGFSFVLVNLLSLLITYPSAEFRDTVLATGMTDGMEASYLRLESLVG